MLIQLQYSTLVITDAVQILWTALVLIVALVLTTLMIFLRRDIAYGLVVIWASTGIASKWPGIPLIYYTAIAVAIIVALLILIVPFIKKKNWVDYYLVRNLEQ